jgi:riboflavin kinase/FMN adenylyltransferase
MKFSGVVLEGARKAGELGFPTVNIPLSERGLAGIYAARVLIKGAAHDAVAYANERRGLLEAHVFDFSENAYGTEITIELLKKLRDDAELNDENELKAAIAEDAEDARAYFRTL